MSGKRLISKAAAILAAAAAVLSFSACAVFNGGPGGGSVTHAPDADPSGVRERFTQLNGDGSDRATVMFYIIGSDLEYESGEASADIGEILSVKSSDSVDLVFQTGGCSDWENEDLSDGTVERCHAENGRPVRVASPEETEMLDVGALSSFIRWSAKEYPANRYFLILWDHGGGLLDGFGYDELDPYSSLGIPDLAKALEEGGVKFDAVGFDACFMATFETAFALEPYADWLIASEESEPSAGWDYSGWLEMLTEDPAADTQALAEKLISDYVAPSVGEGDLRSLSLTDLRLIPRAAEALGELLCGETAPSDGEIDSARENTPEFGGGYYDQIDLLSFAEKFDSPAAVRLKEAFSAAVALNGSNFFGANGLSLYFPFRYPYAFSQNGEKTLEELGFSSGYVGYLRRVARRMTGKMRLGSAPLPAWYSPDEEYDYSAKADRLPETGETDGETTVKLSFSDFFKIDHITVSLEVFDDGSVVSLGRDCDYAFNAEGDLIVDPEQYCMTLDGLTVPFTVLRDDESDDGVFYSYGTVRAQLNGVRDVDLIVYWDNTYAGGYVAGYRYPEGDPNIVFGLEPGDLLDVIVDSYTPDGEYEGEYLWGDPIEVTDGRVSVGYEPLDEYDIRIGYRVDFTDGRVGETAKFDFPASAEAPAG